MNEIITPQHPHADPDCFGWNPPRNAKTRADRYRAAGYERCYVCRQWFPEAELIDLEFLGEEFNRQMACRDH